MSAIEVRISTLKPGTKFRLRMEWARDIHGELTSISPGSAEVYVEKWYYETDEAGNLTWKTKNRETQHWCRDTFVIPAAGEENLLEGL